MKHENLKFIIKVNGKPTITSFGVLEGIVAGQRAKEDLQLYYGRKYIPSIPEFDLRTPPSEPDGTLQQNWFELSGYRGKITPTPEWSKC